METTLFSKIEATIKQLQPKNISAERKATLQPLVDFIQTKTVSI